MGKLILGLDVGITSVGWGIIDGRHKVIDCGVRLFEETDVDNNMTRRSHRSSRRLKRRKLERIREMRSLLVSEGLIQQDFKPTKNPYVLKAKGLTESLDNEELSTILLHYAKRRGSSLETIEDDSSKEDDSPKVVLSRNDRLVSELGYVSRVQMMKLETSGLVRGHSNQFRTRQYVSELSEILSHQKISPKLHQKIIEIITRKRHYSHGPGNVFSSSPYGRYRTVSGIEFDRVMELIQSEYRDTYRIKRFQVELDGKLYSILKSGEIINREPLNLIELMRGKCSLYPDELRAPKLSYSAELHNLLNDLNNLSIRRPESEKLTKDEKIAIIDYLKSRASLRSQGIKGIAKLLNINPDNISGAREHLSNGKIVTEWVGYKKLAKAITHETWVLSDITTMDRISEILTQTQVIEERIESLKSIISNPSDISSVASLAGYSGYHSFSLKALHQLNQEMLETSFNQMQIIMNNQLRNDKPMPKLVADETAILSPVAKRAHIEAIKVVADLMQRYGDFDRIVIETTRDKNSREQKKNIENSQKMFLQQKQQADEILKEHGYDDQNTRGVMINKLRMYQEQLGRCAYSNLPINLSLLISDPHAYEIDHIIPYSVSFDNSMDNKVLVYSITNKSKGNMTPFGYFKSGRATPREGIQTFESFSEIVKGNPNYTLRKKSNLLLEKTMTKFDDLESFINRNLVDTSYAIRTLSSSLKSYFKSNNIDTSVFTVKGKQTHTFRTLAAKDWSKKHSKSSASINPMIKDRDHYRHHAIDALIIAGLSNQRLFSYIYGLHSNIQKHTFDINTGELFGMNPMEDSEFSRFLTNLSEIEDHQIRFSWKHDTKPNRAFSDETIYSTRHIDGEDMVVKKYKDIYTLKSNELCKIFDSEIKKKNLLVYKHDRKTYDILESIYRSHQHEAYPFKAYYDAFGPIRKYSKSGNGPAIQSLKYIDTKLGNHIDITHKFKTDDKKVVLLQLSTYRIDVYRSNEGVYRFVTVRPHDIKKVSQRYQINQDEYRAKCVAKKITESDRFMFSLYRNDIFEIVSKDSEKNTGTFRFITVSDDSRNIIEVYHIHKKTVDRMKPTISKNTLEMTKMTVSPSGMKRRVTQEGLKMVL